MDPLTGIIPRCPEYGTDPDCSFLSLVHKPLDQWLKDGYESRKGFHPGNVGKTHKFVPCHYGKFGPEPFFPLPSLIGIDLINKINDPVQYDIIHVAEITPLMHVLFNGVNIAQAPGYKLGKKGKEISRTQAEKLKFCKSVIWSLMNDEGNLKDHITRCPALECNQVKEEISEPITVPQTVIPAPMEDLSLPEPDPVLSNGDMTGYPELPDGIIPGVIETIDADINEMDPRSNCCDPYYEGYDQHDIDNMIVEVDQPMIAEMYKLINPEPVIIRQWSFAGCLIQEVPA